MGWSLMQCSLNAPILLCSCLLDLLCVAVVFLRHYPNILLLLCCWFTVLPYVCLYIPCTCGVITLKWPNLSVSEPVDECDTLFKDFREKLFHLQFAFVKFIVVFGI